MKAISPHISPTTCCDFRDDLGEIYRLTVVVRITFLLFFLFCQQAVPAEELYIITTADGSQVIVKEYTFTDEYVQFTTPNGLPGFIKRDQFVSIANMIGVPPRKADPTQRSIEEEKKREILIWIVVASVLVILTLLFVLYVVVRKKKPVQGEEIDIYYNRIDREPATQGHLSFQYRGRLGRKTDWVIEVRRAYEEEGILLFEGICTTTEKRKLFRADRVVGTVTDLSSGHTDSIEHFFVDTQE